MLTREPVVLDIHSLSVSIRNRPLLIDVSLTVNAGEIFGLIGPDGAGKTTTVLAALGLLQRSGGTMDILGLDPAKDARAVYRRCGVVPELIGFYEWMNAQEYLRFFGRLHGHERSERDIGDRLAQVGLDPANHRRIKTFSRSMRQRLALARALIGDPSLLILDEPTAALSATDRDTFHELLTVLAAQGMGILLCTRFFSDDVNRLCKRVGIIEQGRTIVGRAGQDMAGAASLRLRLRMDGPIPRTARQPPHMSLVLETPGWSIVDVDADISPETAWNELYAAGWPVAAIHGSFGSERHP